ncbi:MAG: YggS family pyridoxal phosphate-dependent enzyme [Candidatus Tectomicrobia bacterium]|nr:YggS family pyridoxal phosphate-dependent enzyme [Candidatus Tectomicrobia bacterium]
MSTIAENLKIVGERIEKAAIRSGRSLEEIQLVAVTKTVEPARIREAIDAGATAFGENWIQEAKPKIEEIGRGVEWHFIGHLQSNKVKFIFDLFDLIHSVDSLSLAQEIGKRAKARGMTADLLIQVNVSRELTKEGLDLEEVFPTIEAMAALPSLRIKGLMTIAPLSYNSEDSRPYFRSLRELALKIKSEKIDGVSMDELSMGMSGDFEVAIEEGATLVRVGSAIFGERPHK